MKQADFAGIVPDQYTGKEIKAECHVALSDESDAKTLFTQSKRRLLCVNNWHKIAGLISAHFQLLDANGKEVERNAEAGDYIRIDLPGPGSSEGDGYDWVCIEDLKELKDDNIETLGFRVRPSENPFGKKKETAHFYSSDATSSFIINRDGQKVSAIIIDRNVKPNDDTGSITDKIRHTTIAMGAIGLFSKLQRQSLAEGFIQKGNIMNK